MIALVLIQASIVSPMCSNAWFKLDMLIPFITFLSIQFGKFDGLIFGVIGGFFEDALSFSPFGIHALALGLVGFGVGFIYEWIYRKESWVLFFMVFISTSIAIVVYALIENYHIHQLPIKNYVSAFYIPMVITHILLSPVIFFILRKVYIGSVQRRSI